MSESAHLVLFIDGPSQGQSRYLPRSVVKVQLRETCYYVHQIKTETKVWFVATSETGAGMDVIMHALFLALAEEHAQ